MSDDRTLLTVDCGNSTIDCLRHRDRARLRLPTRRPDLAALAQFVRDQSLDRCVAATVVDGALDPVAATLAVNSIPLRIAGKDLRCPLRLDYGTPETLGADRWLGALAAHHRHGRSIVVDCGSATTINLVEADGSFRGGPIAPGLRAFVAGMAAVTPALPPASLDAAAEALTRTSQSAVDTGVLLGYAGLVERLVAAVLATAQGPAQVVVTGGNAERLLRCSRLRARAELDLVHEGLRLLASSAGGER